jgi:hypothetical protein
LEFLESGLGHIWIYFRKPGVFLTICGLRVDFTEGQGVNCKIGGDFPPRNFFSMGKYNGLGPPSVDRGRCQSTVDRGWGLGGGSSELGPWPLWSTGAHRQGTIERGEHRDPGLGLTEAQTVVERRCDGDDERR